MAICYYCSGSARCHVCTGTGIQGDGRTCAVCGGNGRCTHCTGGVMRRPDAPLGRLAVAERVTNAGNLVASDTFQGVLAGVATAVLSVDGLVPGAR